MRGLAIALVTAGAAAYGCSSFREETTGGAVPSPDAGGALPERGTPDGHDGGGPRADASDDTGAGCTTDCVFFEDAFERDAGAVLGMWSTSAGQVSLVPEAGRGNVFSSAAPAAVDGTERVGLLTKVIAPRTNVRVNADLRVQLGGTFGSGAANDYCDFVSVYADTTRVATLFMDANGLGAWQLGGGDTYFVPGPVLAAEWTSVELAVTTTPYVSVVAKANGVGLALAPPTPVQPPGGTMSVQIGLRCAGVTPNVQALVDDVVLRSIP